MKNKMQELKKPRKVTKLVSIYISGFGYKDKERRLVLYAKWSFKGGNVSNSRILFDREVYEKGIEVMEKEFQDSTKAIE